MHSKSDKSRGLKPRLKNYFRLQVVPDGPSSRTIPIAVSLSRAASAARTSLSGLADRITFIDLATIFPLDEETIRAEYSRIGKALIVEDTPSAGSVGECVLALLSQCPCYHPGSVRLLSALPMPLPCPRKLEEEVLVSDAAIREAAAALLGL